MTRFWTMAVALALTPLLHAQDSDESFVRLTPEQMEWTMREDGSGFVFLQGNPDAEGIYIQRLIFPPGRFSAPHYHDQDRFVTVISGVWHTGIGPSGDRDDTVPLPAGSYMMHPAGAVHYDGAKEEAVVVEIRGMGPVETIFVEE